jgi:hypothetical protein
MADRNILKKNYIYFTGLLLLVAALPVSLFVTSLSQFILLGAFFLEGDVNDKFKRFFANKAALLLAGIWLMHCIGLLWTEDIQEGLKDCRIKLPLLLIPLVVAGNKPLSIIRFRWVLYVFIASVFCASLISMAVLTGIIQRNIYDIRDIFIFNISHIRFSLFVCLSAFSVLWLTFYESKKIKLRNKLLALMLVIWFILFLIIVESVTGLLIFSLTGLLLLLYHIYTSVSPKSKIILSATVLVLPLVFILLLQKFVRDFYHNHPYPINVAEKTALGNYYFFNLEEPLYENGYPVWVYVCDDEMRTSWNKLSAIPFDSLDERNQPIKFTLIRFLASKGLRKDAEGVATLTPKERKSIERGIANVNYQEISSIRARFLQIMWEFDQFIKGGNPSGHSVTQRFEFWKAAIGIASDNIFVGVGTGDMPHAYRDQYISMKSSLDEKHRLRAHNQYLAILVAFGIPGLIYFLCAFFYPMFHYRRQVGFLFSVFFLITFFSMFSEDTLETQAGVTFVALFFSVMLFSRPLKD